MVRLVFRPLTHVRRTICTLVSLRASTRVSSGFTLRTLSSPSFGSHHVCSDAVKSLETPVDAATLRLRTIHFHFALEFSIQILANIIVSLVRVSRRVIYGHFVNIPNTLMDRICQTIRECKLHADLHSQPPGSSNFLAEARVFFLSPGQRMQQPAITVTSCEATHLPTIFLRCPKLMLARNAAKYLRPPWRLNAPWRTPPCIPRRFRQTE